MIKNLLNFTLILCLAMPTYSTSKDSLDISRIKDTIISDFLKRDKIFDIQLPKSYHSEEDKNYPLIVVLDADYMFNLVAGTVDILSYFGEIPENIVVGIKQSDSRFKDSSVLDNINFTPITSTASFYDFISTELIPHISKKYRTSEFKVIVGHERTANFAQFFLLKSKPIFRGIISISPKFSDNMKDYLKQNFSNLKSKIVYTLSSSEKDFESIYNNVKDLSLSLDSLKNPNLKFKSLIFKNENHFQLPVVSIPQSIRETYSLYSDINKTEYDSIISKIEISPIDYLLKKYDQIKDFYDYEKRISINDFNAMEIYIEEFESFELYDELSKLALKEYPGTILPSYYKGRFFQETGKLKKAMQIYRSAYNMEEVEGLSKDYLLSLADKIEEDFNK